MEQFQINRTEDTIAAISSPAGTGGVAVIRISGPDAISIVNEAWDGVDLNKVNSHTIHLGNYISTEGRIIDRPLASVFISPASFTGENIVELSVHGSTWIQKEIINDLAKRGVRMANPGEFTQRAFLNGKIDLAQAEGIADLIGASSKAAHQLAISQTKGTFSKEFELLKDNLVEFASLLELELDFSEEDVEFADRLKLIELCERVLSKIKKLADSFYTGSVLKNGVPVVIAGIPNAGKSSLLNLLLNEDKAIVTNIPGTTRDTIEDTVEIEGVLFRFIDTAGLRDTEDPVEVIGVKRAHQALDKAHIVIWIIDSSQPVEAQVATLRECIDSNPVKKFIILQNKIDISPENISQMEDVKDFQNYIPFSTFTKQGLDKLTKQLVSIATAGQNPESDIIITNARHHQALTEAYKSLSRAFVALQTGISADFIAQDIRQATSALSSLTGSITSDTLLHSIFSRFCIGK